MTNGIEWIHPSELTLDIARSWRLIVKCSSGDLKLCLFGIHNCDSRQYIRQNSDGAWVFGTADSPQEIKEIALVDCPRIIGKA